MNLTRFHSRISEVITYTKLEPTTLSSTLLIGEISYNLILLCVGDLGPNLEQEKREGENRKGLKRLKRLNQPRAGGGIYTRRDRSDWFHGPVRPFGLQHPPVYDLI